MRVTKVDAPGVEVASATYSAAVLAEGAKTLFISGQGPRDLDADPETQIRQTFEQIGSILESVGATFKNVAMIRGYFLDMPRDMGVFRKVRAEFLSDPYPASTCVGVTALAIRNLQVEIEAIAVL